MSWLFTAWTVLVAVVFTGIALWAYSGKRHADFEAAARIPFEEDDSPDKTKREELENG